MDKCKVAVITGADALQQPVGRVGKPKDIAEIKRFPLYPRFSMVYLM